MPSDERTGPGCGKPETNAGSAVIERHRVSSAVLVPDSVNRCLKDATTFRRSGYKERTAPSPVEDST